MDRGEREPILTRQLFEAVQAKRVPAQDAHRMSAKESADAVDSRRRTPDPEGRPANRSLSTIELVLANLRGMGKIVRYPCPALEKAKTEKEAHGEFESEPPGYCGAQDTFYVGNLKGQACLPANLYRHLRQGCLRQAL